MRITTHWSSDDILVTDEVHVATDRETFRLTADEAEALAHRLIIAAAQSRTPQN